MAFEPERLVPHRIRLSCPGGPNLVARPERQRTNLFPTYLLEAGFPLKAARRPPPVSDRFCEDNQNPPAASHDRRTQGVRRQLLYAAPAYAVCGSTLVGSIFTPGPIDDEMATRLTKVPFAPDGFALTIAATNARAFSAIWSSLKLALPMPA